MSLTLVCYFEFRGCLCLPAPLCVLLCYMAVLSCVIHCLGCFFFPDWPISSGPTHLPMLCQRRVIRRISGSPWGEVDERSPRKELSRKSNKKSLELRAGACRSSRGKNTLYICQHYSRRGPIFSVMLLTETFEMRKRLLTLSMAEPRYNAETILKTHEMFIMYITLLFHFKKMCKKIAAS